MKKGNEEGYALLIVLLVVSFILIVSATFIAGSLSHAKQESTVDSNNLAVVAAEMGVDYYKTALTNRVNEVKESLMAYAQSEIDKRIENEENIDQSVLDGIRGQLVAKLEGIIKREVNQFDHDGAKTVSATVGYAKGDWSFTSLSSAGEVNIKGPVTGWSDEDNDKDLTFNMTFQIPELNYEELAGEGIGGDESGELIYDMHNLYPDDSKLPVCGNIVSEGETCKDSNRRVKLQGIDEKVNVYFPNKYIGDNPNNHDYRGSNLYFKDGMTINNNANSTRNVNFFINGPLHVNGNMNGLANSKIILNGTMTLNNNLKMRNSAMMIRGAVTVGNGLELQNNSKVCIEGSAKIKDLTINSSSEVYIWGALEAKLKGSGKVHYPSSAAELWDKCIGSGSGGSERDPLTLGNIKWQAPRIDVTY